MESTDYYISVPPRSLLHCVVCTVDPDEIRDSSAKSYFHWKTLKCRYIINVLPTSVVASPIYKSKGAFYVIVTKDFYKTGVLQRTLAQLNVKHALPQIVTPRAYVDCLKYTLEFYISPMWNKVGQIYMKNPNFLENLEFNSAMSKTMNLISRETSSLDEIRISLTPLAAKLPPMKLEHLAIPSMVLAPFLQDPEGILDLTMYSTQRVTVIPSMRKAMVKRVLRKLPSTSCFANYGEIRRHWKNMYGYRLPKTDEGVLYFEVSFQVPNAEPFIYPDICIRRDLSQRSADSPDLLKRDFLQNLVTSMPTVLHQSLQVFQTSQQSNLQTQTLNISPETESKGFTTPFPIRSPENVDSARLSLTGAPFRRTTSRQMSPTPSLKGLSSDEDRKKLRFENLKRIKEIHNTVPASSKVAAGPKAQKPVKVFLNESDKSKYFSDSTDDASRKKSVNIFGPLSGKKENVKEDEEKSKIKIVSVSTGNYPWFS